MSDLRSDLEKEKSDYSRLGKQNYGFAYVLVIGIGLASAASGVTGLSAVLNPKWVGLLGIIPLIFSVLAAILKPQARANFHYYYLEGLDEFSRRLRDEGADPAQITRELTKFRREMNERWKRELSLEPTPPQNPGKPPATPPPPLPPQLN